MEAVYILPVSLSQVYRLLSNSTPCCSVPIEAERVKQKVISLRLINGHLSFVLEVKA